jgi:hypothetical protein
MVPSTLFMLKPAISFVQARKTLGEVQLDCGGAQVSVNGGNAGY